MAAAITVILSRQSPFIAHRRVGQNGRELWIVKLRTMWSSRPWATFKWIFVERLPVNSCTNPVKKINGDPRIHSSFAVFCRRFSIDELPQLWQVACGQLALVGPRAITKHEIETYYGSQAELLVSRKPGLTGLWQVTGRSRLSYHQRRRLDLFMLRRWCLPLYLLILARTILQVPVGKDAW
jgi:lipopolysaccharide/colanic/teichoic acid biosynthesis glycosyltransferase